MVMFSLISILSLETYWIVWFVVGIGALTNPLLTTHPNPEPPSPKKTQKKKKRQENERKKLHLEFMH